MPKFLRLHSNISLFRLPHLNTKYDMNENTQYICILQCSHCVWEEDSNLIVEGGRVISLQYSLISIKISVTANLFTSCFFACSLVISVNPCCCVRLSLDLQTLLRPAFFHYPLPPTCLCKHLTWDQNMFFVVDKMYPFSIVFIFRFY